MASVFRQYYFTNSGVLKGTDGRSNVLTEQGPFDSYDPIKRIIETTSGRLIHLPKDQQETSSFLQASTQKWLKDLQK